MYYKLGEKDTDKHCSALTDEVVVKLFNSESRYGLDDELSKFIPNEYEVRWPDQDSHNKLNSVLFRFRWAYFSPLIMPLSVSGDRNDVAPWEWEHCCYVPTDLVISAAINLALSVDIDISFDDVIIYCKYHNLKKQKDPFTEKTFEVNRTTVNFRWHLGASRIEAVVPTSIIAMIFRGVANKNLKGYGMNERIEHKAVARIELIRK